MTAAASDDVSDFLWNTCQIDPLPNVDRLIAWQFASPLRMPVGHSSDMYIQPIFRYDRAFDFMEFGPTWLAVSRNQARPQLLPLGFDECVEVFEIIDTDFPSYVLLRHIGWLVKRLNRNSYFFKSRNISDHSFHAEAAHQSLLHSNSGTLVRDFSNEFAFDIYTVEAVRCLEWPTQADEWSRRRRRHGWPDPSTLNTVVSNGCDLIQVAHRSCRRDEYMRYHHWRFSFSRAESLLLNSWTPKQQIVYHVLRFFLRKSGLRNLRDADRHRLVATYSVKTLMLWSCEQHDSCWWARSNIVKLCSNILQMLLECCRSSSCKGYFVSASNLFEVRMPESVMNQLESYKTVASLTRWLIKNYMDYIRECAAKSSFDVGNLLSDNATATSLRLSSNAIVEWKQRDLLTAEFTVVKDLIRKVYSEFHSHVTARKQRVSKDAQMFRCHMKQLCNFVWRSCHEYVKSMFCLSFLSMCELRDISRIDSAMCDELYETLTSDDQLEWVARNDESEENIMLFRATHLLRLCCSETNHVTYSLFLFLSYAYLRMVVRRVRGKNDSLHCLAKVYLAVVCCTTRNGRKGATVCKQVTKSVLTKPRKCISHVVEGRCLPRLSSDVDNVCGLIAIYHYFKKHAILDQQQQASFTDAFSISLFACYLRLLSYRISTDNRANMSREMMKRATKRTKRSDELLLHSTEVCPLQCTVRELRRLLVVYSVEQLTAFQQMSSEKFKSLCTIATTDFRAMHAYKCGMYQQCLELSVVNAEALWDESRLYFTIPTYGVAIHLLPNDVISLSGCLSLRSDENEVLQLTMFVSLRTLSLSQLENNVTAVRKELRETLILYKRHSKGNILDRLLLAFSYRKAVIQMKRVRLLLSVR